MKKNETITQAKHSTYRNISWINNVKIITEAYEQ